MAGNEAAETKDDRAVPQSNQRYILKQTTQSHQEKMKTNLRLLIVFFLAAFLARCLPSFSDPSIRVRSSEESKSN